MKTLDEVIRAVDGQHSLFELQGCFECHYSGDGNSCVGSCIMVDALHYLKEYRTILPLVPSLINTAIAVQKKGKTIG